MNKLIPVIISGIAVALIVGVGFTSYYAQVVEIQDLRDNAIAKSKAEQNILNLENQEIMVCRMRKIMGFIETFILPPLGRAGEPAAPVLRRQTTVGRVAGAYGLYVLPGRSVRAIYPNHRKLRK